MLFLLVAALILSLSLTFAQDKYDCSKPCETKAVTSKSCCMEKSKVASKVSATSKSTVMFASDKKTAAKTSATCTMDAKECAAMKGAKVTGECTAAEKAHCEAMQAKLVKADGKADCCKDKAKTAKVEKKSVEKSDAKGTN
jgi:hypothetical protein